jgi:flagellar protein FliO/FliZ
MIKCFSVGLALLALGVQTALAETTLTGTTTGVSAGSVLQMLLGLVMVLAMVVGAAWLLKRLTALRGTGTGPIQVIAGAAVGPRERIVLVEVGETWLLVGVAAGQVNTLHIMSRSDLIAAPDVRRPVPSAVAFASWLRRAGERRNGE